MQEDYTANTADYNDGLPSPHQKRLRGGSDSCSSVKSKKNNKNAPAVTSLADVGAGAFVFAGGKVAAPKNWAEWEAWGRSLDVSSVVAVQSSLALVAPSGVDGETGEMNTGKVARSVKRASEKMGVFKNNAPEPTCAPLSNTGAHNSKNETAAFIDYVGCTFKGENALEQACMMFGAGQEWTPLDHGGYRYDKAFKRGDVTIYHGGQYYNKGVMVPHDTVFVVSSGQGCRQLEDEGLINGFGSLEPGMNPWRAFLGDLLAMGCTFPRLDVAIDDREHLLNLDTIEECLDADLCCMRFQDYERRRPKRAGGGIKGDSINIGNRQSLMFIRIYNKHLEQIVKGEIAQNAPVEHWIRCEMEAHNEKATKLAQAIFQYGMKAAAAVLWCAIDFKSAEGNEDKHNRSRRKTVAWWQTFIDVVTKLPLTLEPRVRTVEKVYKWVVEQVAPSLALLDNLPGREGLIDAIVQVGGERLRGVHLSMLKQYAASVGAGAYA